METAKAIVDRLWSALEAKDLVGIRELCLDSTETAMPGGVRTIGPDQLVSLLHMYNVAFPDLRHEIVNYVEAGNKIAVELRTIATHTGPMQTPNGTIPPTGKSVVWESVDMITISGDKIASWHAYFDQLAFLMQLGLAPAPAAA